MFIEFSSTSFKLFGFSRTRGQNFKIRYCLVGDENKNITGQKQKTLKVEKNPNGFSFKVQVGQETITITPHNKLIIILAKVA